MDSFHHKTAFSVNLKLQILMRILSMLFLIGLFFTACQDSSSTTKANEEAAKNMEPETETKAMEPAVEALISPDNAKYKLSAFSPSTDYSDAKMKEMRYIQDKFVFEVEGTNYKLGEQTPDAGQKMCANSGKGQHIHLIVDNKPYAARYTAEFDDYKLESGEHYVLAFLSRSYHESIKTKDAHLARKVEVSDNMIKRAESVSESMLFYSRPKGTYTGKANTEKVMLDFYIANLKLGKNYKVQAEINGEETHTISVWQPYYIEGLPLGKNTVKLTLVDGEGKVVDTPLNPVTREFELKADGLE